MRVTKEKCGWSMRLVFFKLNPVIPVIQPCLKHTILVYIRSKEEMDYRRDQRMAECGSSDDEGDGEADNRKSEDGEADNRKKMERQ